MLPYRMQEMVNKMELLTEQVMHIDEKADQYFVGYELATFVTKIFTNNNRVFITAKYRFPLTTTVFSIIMLLQVVGEIVGATEADTNTATPHQ
jgi:hypothetical protein